MGLFNACTMPRKFGILWPEKYSFCYFNAGITVAMGDESIYQKVQTVYCALINLGFRTKWHWPCARDLQK